MKISERFISEIVFGLCLSDLSVNFIAGVCVWAMERLP